jgi:enoyl-CoA hydratase/carnithine racemase
MVAVNAPASFAIMKRQLREADLQDFEAARTDAYTLTQETLKSADFKESMTAKREKRLARFTPVTAVFEPPVSKA